MNKISIVTESQSNRRDASQQAPFEREKGRKLNLERHETVKIVNLFFRMMKNCTHFTAFFRQSNE